MNYKGPPLNINTAYDSKMLYRDFFAGLTIFVMLVPQGMAYAMLAGLPPVMGLYASTIPLIMYAFFATSKHVSVGPVAISSLLVFSGVAAYAEPGTSEYISLVILLALMVGVIQLLLGLFKTGFIVKFISTAVMSGYTSAAAIVIALSQLNHLLGMNLGNHLQVQHLFFEAAGKLNEIHMTTLTLGVLSITALILLKNAFPRFPAPLFIVLLSTLAVYLFGMNERGVEIVGDVPEGLPSFTLPDVSFVDVQMLFAAALTIALIGFMETLAIGKTIAEEEKYTVDPNKELKALGISNMAGSLFQAYPVSGSFSRSAVNHQAGAVTQLSTVFTGVFVIITLLFFTSSFYYLPNAVLAAIIMVAVYKLIDIRSLRHFFAVKPIDGWVWILTFVVTLIIGINLGIIFGVIFSLLLLLKRSANPNIVELGYLEKDEIFRDITRFPEAEKLEDTVIIRIDAALHFANTGFIDKKLAALLTDRGMIQWVIIDMSGVNDIDTSSVDFLKELVDQYKKEHDIQILFVNMKGPVRDTVKKSQGKEGRLEKVSYLNYDRLLKDREIKR